MLRWIELLAPIPVIVFMAFPVSKIIAGNIVQKMIANEKEEMSERSDE